MGKVVRRAKVVWKGTLKRGAGALTVGSGLLGKSSTPVTFASRVEQPEGQTSPEALVAAAHAACYAMALSKTLAEDGASPDWLAVDAACTLDDEALEITGIDLDVRGDAPGIGDEEFQTAAQEAEQSCPVSNALRGNLEIRLTANANAPRVFLGASLAQSHEGLRRATYVVDQAQKLERLECPGDIAC